ncbi:hypothetical protein RDABS01_029284 [Bienertia sinuspersici]
MEGEPRLVSELIEERVWNGSLLNALFNQKEVNAIMSIPLSLFGGQDSWTWHYNADGNFSVRSAYFEELKAKGQPSTSSDSVEYVPIWKHLWKVQTLPKVKNFGWRVLHGALPVRANLKRRGMEVDEKCPMCGEGAEDIAHMLCFCPDARFIWRISPIRLDIRCTSSLKLQEWVKAMVTNQKDERWWRLFWNIAWGIWKRRNVWVFENKKRRVEEVVDKAVSMAGEYERAFEALGSRREEGGSNTMWASPSMGTYKINSDAAMFEDGSVGLGVIARDYMGDVMLSSSWRVQGVNAVDVAEAMAARHALKIAVEAGLRKVILETDCKKLVNHLKKGCCDLTYFGRVVSDILQIASVCNEISFSHVKRSGNLVAHKLARISKDYVDMIVWMEEVPSQVIDLVDHDVMNLKD